MAERIPQSIAYTVIFKAYLTTTGLEATGKTIAITISKNTAAFGNPSAGATNATEIASGWYFVALSTTDTGTLGPIAIRGTASGINDVGEKLTVVNANTGGLAALPNTAVTTNASLITSGTGTDQLGLTAGGKVSETVLTDTVTTYTGNTPQTGDNFARIGVAGVGLTNLGDARIANLDATVSSRMATYTQPAGFLAATFPATVASPTNITAGIITTVTNLTNAPTAGDLTATMKTSVTTAATAATPTAAAVTGNVGGNVVGNVNGNVVGSVGSVVGLTVANLDATISSRASAAALATVQSDTDDIQTRLPAALVGGRIDSSVGAMAANTLTASALATDAVTEIQTGLATPTNITAGVITTVTNLTNAPTAGDFTAVMKTSLNAATPASIAGAVGSVTGNVGGNVVGSVGSVVGLTASNLDATISSRLAAASYTAPDNADIVAIRVQTDKFVFTAANKVDSNTLLIEGLDATDQIRDSILSDATRFPGADIDATISSRSTFAGGAVASVAGNVGGNVVGSVGSVVGLTVSNLDATVSSRLASASYTAPDNAGIAAINFITAATLDATVSSRATVATIFTQTIEAGLTFLDFCKGVDAILLGKVSGAATVTNTFRNAVADTKNRVVATVDADGNRTAIVYDFS